MPDTDVNKPGKTPPPSGGGQDAAAAGADAAQAPVTLEDELDLLLSEINAAVEELDPSGNLENAAAKARNAAVAGDPDYDELEDMFEVVVPEKAAQKQAEEQPDAGAETPSVQPEPQNEEQNKPSVDAELDDLIDSTPATKTSADHSQIDSELDALLAEAGTLLEDGKTPAAAETAETAEPEEKVSAVAAPAQAQAQVQEPDAKAEPEQTGDLEAVEPEKPSAEAAGRSIEDVDADLADRADTVAKEETGSEAEVETAAKDGFESSEDVIEEVIDEHASAVQSDEDAAAEAEQKDTDDLAQLMAESPASASVGVDASPGAAPKASKPESGQPTAPEGKAATDVSAPKPAVAAPVTAVKSPAPAKFSVVRRGIGVARPGALWVARILSKPLEMVPPRVRDDIGWLSIVTIFLAITVLVAWVLFR